MLRVLVREDRLRSRDTPVNTQRFVKDTDTTIRLWVIKLITLILEYRYIREHRKTMRHPLRNEKLTMIRLRELHSDMLPVGGRALTDIHRDIKDGTSYTTHEFALGIGWTLEMQASHHSIS